MKRSPRPKTPRSAEPGAAALRLSGPSEQLHAAMRSHEKLVERIARRRRDLDRLQEEARATITAVAGRMAPLTEEWRRLDAAIHALFDALLGGKRAARARKQIRRIYLHLQDAGMITPRDDNDDAAMDDPWPDPDEPFDDGAEPSSAHHAHLKEAQSAPKQHDRGALRDLYRRLVELLHPDQVQDEEDKARRTEAMKAVTVAFRHGDFGRLIEIERAWATTAEARPAEDDVEQRLAHVEAQNRELGKQLRALDQQLRALRRSPEGQIARDVQQSGAGGRELAVAAAVGEAEHEIARVRTVHEFVAAFHDGKMTMADFLVGPPVSVKNPFDELEFDDDLADSFADLMNVMEAHFAAEAKPRSKGAARKGGRRKS